MESLVATIFPGAASPNAPSAWPSFSRYAGQPITASFRREPTTGVCPFFLVLLPGRTLIDEIPPIRYFRVDNIV